MLFFLNTLNSKQSCSDTQIMGCDTQNQEPCGNEEILKKYLHCYGAFLERKNFFQPKDTGREEESRFTPVCVDASLNVAQRYLGDRLDTGAVTTRQGYGSGAGRPRIRKAGRKGQAVVISDICLFPHHQHHYVLSMCKHKGRFVPLACVAVARTKQSRWSSSLDLWSKLVLRGSMERAFLFLSKASEMHQQHTVSERQVRRTYTKALWSTGLRTVSKVH